MFSGFLLRLSVVILEMFIHVPLGLCNKAHGSQDAYTSMVFLTYFIEYILITTDNTYSTEA